MSDISSLTSTRKISLQIKHYSKTGQTTKAIELAQALIKETGDFRGYVNLAEIYISSGDKKNAISAATTAVRLKSFHYTYITLAKAYMVAGKLDSALDYVNKSLLCTRKDYCKAKSLYFLAEILRKQKKYQESLNTLFKIPASFQERSAELCKAYCYMEFGNYAAAFIALTRAEFIFQGEFVCAKIRLYAGYIFLANKHILSGKDIPQNLLRKIQEAKNTLQQKIAIVFPTQKNDYNSALQIIEQLGI